MMKFTFSSEIDGTIPEDKILEKLSDIQEEIIQEINNKIVKNDYGNSLNLIFICPMILKLPHLWFDLRKERKLVKHTFATADYRTRIDYNLFRDESIENRKKMLIKNIIDSVRSIKSKKLKSFNGKKLEQDICNILNYQYDD
jgi:hypothetical protein